MSRHNIEMQGYWLVKSEEADYSIAQLKKDKKTQWTGVRNYQARNFLMAMKVNDRVLFYHSNGEPPGVAGTAVVTKVAYPDPTQFEPKSDYYDAKSTQEKPRWYAPELTFESVFLQLVSLDELRKHKTLEAMSLLQRGSRLSVHCVTVAEFEFIVKLGAS